MSPICRPESKPDPHSRLNLLELVPLVRRATDRTDGNSNLTFGLASVGRAADAALNRDTPAIHLAPTLLPKAVKPQCADRRNANGHEKDHQATERDGNHGVAATSQQKEISPHSMRRIEEGSKRSAVTAACSCCMTTGSSALLSGNAVMICPEEPMATRN